MIIEKNKVVAFNYTLKDREGQLLDTSQGREPLTYLHGAGHIIPGLESALDGKAAGDQFTAVVEPDDAYGQPDEAMTGKVPKANLDGIENVSVGTQLQAQTPEGPRIVRVVDMDDDTVTIDANHPLAGVTLHFDVTVGDVRDATAEEIEHGHVHRPGETH